MKTIRQDGVVSFDWDGFEREAHASLVTAVAAGLRAEPSATSAMLGHIYRETRGEISSPVLGVGGTSWNPADCDHIDDEWLDVEALSAYASAAATAAEWDRTFQRHLDALVAACVRARQTLTDGGVVGPDFVVVLLDDEFGESLIKRVLPAGEVSRHFPWFGERDAVLPTLSPAELAGLLDTYEGPVTATEARAALLELGPAAWPALIPLVSVPGQAWRAAKLLADLGVPGEPVISALTAALPVTDGSDQRWVAAALSRLGRLDLVLGADLPPEVVAGAVAAPYRGFRNEAVVALPLDYGPLAAVLANRPALAPLVAEELKPGSEFCDITADEVATAERALESPHEIIRAHAEDVLEWWTFGHGE